MKNPSGVLALIVGGLIGLASLGLLTAGAGLAISYAVGQNDDGFVTSPTVDMSSDGYALTTSEIDLASSPGEWWPSRFGDVQVTVESADDAAVFVGIAPSDALDDYLSGVNRDVVTDVESTIVYDTVGSDPLTVAPTAVDFWVSSATGTGEQTLEWPLEQGAWTLAVINADGSEGVDVRASGGIRIEAVWAIAAGLVFLGLIGAMISAVLVVVAVRQPSQDAAQTVPVGQYPVAIEGAIDPSLSRGMWLIKWFLAIPHLIVLGFLWVAFGLLTVVAFFGILFTGRYPRSIFDFNVGVLRWNWRVMFYAFNAMGTDQYPPFSLDDDPSYPARLNVTYPQQLSRGLVLVKWWLLAIPHYIIVGLLINGLAWWATDVGTGDAILQTGGGLIGFLAFIAVVLLAISGTYPQGLFDVIMGFNRWVYRVAAYAGLMTDEYPPFRLDSGGNEPGTTPPDLPLVPDDEDARLLADASS